MQKTILAPSENIRMIHYRKKNHGFTLIELIVVMSLISILLFITIPKLDTTILSNSSKKTAQWVILKAQTLKEKALHEQKLYILHIGITDQKMWISSGGMSDEELEGSKQNAYEMPEDIRIVDVEYPVKGITSFGTADIYFYPKGYSDKALVRLEDDDNQYMTFLIEPFLPQVIQYPKYVSFDDY